MKATFKDVVLGTPAGKKVLKKAIKKSCKDQVKLLVECKNKMSKFKKGDKVYYKKFGLVHKCKVVTVFDNGVIAIKGKVVPLCDKEINNNIETILIKKYKFGMIIAEEKNLILR